MNHFPYFWLQKNHHRKKYEGPYRRNSTYIYVIYSKNNSNQTLSLYTILLQNKYNNLIAVFSSLSQAYYNSQTFFNRIELHFGHSRNDLDNIIGEWSVVSCGRLFGSESFIWDCYPLCNLLLVCECNASRLIRKPARKVWREKS